VKGRAARPLGIERKDRNSTVRGGMFASLSIRNYRLYFTGQMISGAGTWMQNIAIGWFALELSHSGVVLGLVTGARYAPPLLLAPWGGLAADRLSIRPLLMATQTGACLLSLTLAVVSATGHGTLAALFAVVIVLGLIEAVDNPARQSLISRLVARDHIGNAVTLASVAANASRAVGPGVAAALIAWLGVTACFVVNAASFAAVIISLVMMREVEFVSLPRRDELADGVLAALRYVWRTRAISAPLIMVAATGTLTWEFPVSLPLITSSTFGGTATDYGLAMSALGVGAVVGGLAAARRSQVTIRSLSLSAVVWGATIFIAALSPVVFALYVALFAVGACAITFNSAAKTLLQLSCRPHMRGRVMSLWFMAWQGSTVIGAPLVGAIGNTFGGRYALGVGAAAAILVGVVYLPRPAGTTA
jgi:MFS family permease